MRKVQVSEHEAFWLEVIRAASSHSDPIPTLWRTQELRLLFNADGTTLGRGLAALLSEPSEAGMQRPTPLWPYRREASSTGDGAIDHMATRNCAYD